jgi:hypothetical protein
MVALSRAYRRAQLWGVRAFDREMFFDLYRRAVGLKQSSNVPLGLTSLEMIEAILDREDFARIPSKVMRAIDA